MRTLTMTDEQYGALCDILTFAQCHQCAVLPGPNDSEPDTEIYRMALSVAEALCTQEDKWTLTDQGHWVRGCPKYIASAPPQDAEAAGDVPL